MEIAIMVEGQNGLNWERWQRLAHAVEELGFTGLYRSDHFTNPQPPDYDSLEAWVSMTWLASHTQRIEFGPLVSPLSFRHPVWLARTAAAIDDLSGGRLNLGVGAGWQEREHKSFGFELSDKQGRMARFEEGLEVITGLLHRTSSFSFSGKYYQLGEAKLLPHPQRKIPIVIGGNGEKRTLGLVAQYASEWNGVFITAERFRELNGKLDALLTEQGRQPHEVRRSLMTGVTFARTEADLKKMTEEGSQSPEQLRQRGFVVGIGSQIVDQLGEFSEAGVQRIMLNWFNLDDMDGLAELASAVL